MIEDGDIINLDVTVFVHGMHADLNETFFIGNVDADSRMLVRTAFDCLKNAIEMGVLLCCVLCAVCCVLLGKAVALLVARSGALTVCCLGCAMQQCVLVRCTATLALLSARRRARTSVPW